MIKQLLIVILILVTLIGVSWCIKTDKMAKLIVRIDTKNIKSIALNTTRNNFINDKRNLFKFAFRQNTLFKIKYIRIGEKAILDFGNNPPDKILINDSLLNPNGEYLYTNKETIEVPFSKENGRFYFTIEKHKASALSSVYIENKTDYRGFRITAYWGKNKYFYAFVIKTDSY